MPNSSTGTFARAQGRWRDILMSIGVPATALTGKHGPCPICKGTDRWRFDDKEGRGTFFCTHCGAGNGLSLVRQFRALNMRDALDLIDSFIGAARIAVPKAEMSDEKQREIMTTMWHNANTLDGADIASRYLQARGVNLGRWPDALRWTGNMGLYKDGKFIARHMGMLAKFTAADNSGAILHRTFLQEPGTQADVERPKTMMAGKIPRGGAVRLGPAGETMGIAEGIETALSASILAGIPVWSALSASGLQNWNPPKEAKHIIIYADIDKSFTGQMAAYCLAYRLKAQYIDQEKTERYRVEVHMTQFTDRGLMEEDWNDFHVSQALPHVRSPLPPAGGLRAS